MSVLRHIVRKEFLQLRRDRKMIPILTMAPVIQLVILGYAANLDLERVPLLLVDRDRSVTSRELLHRFTGSGYFELVEVLEDEGKVEEAFVRGRAQIALVIGAGYGKAVASGRTGEIQILADGSDGNSTNLGLAYAAGLLTRMAREDRRRPQWGTGQMAESEAWSGAPETSVAPPRGISPAATGRIELRPRVWYNPDLTSRWFYLPAILAMVLMMTTMVLPSMAVVREKEIGTLEQISVTPVRPWEFILGKLLPFALIGLLTTVLVTALTVGWFQVPLRGSLLLLLVLTLLFQFSTLGLGLLTSTLVRNQQQAMLSSILLLQVPMIYLSGLMFPIESMPAVIRGITYLIPLRYYNTVIRGIFLKGAGLETLWPQALVLLIYGLAILGLASKRFRKRLD